LIAYHAVQWLAAVPTAQNITQIMVAAVFWPVPDPQFPQDMSGLYTYPDNLTAIQAIDPVATLDAKNARRTYWTGQPMRRRNTVGP
jgi:hypothetical protein